MRVTPSWQDTNNRGRDHLKSSSGQRDLLHSAHSLLWLGLCRAHSLHWLGIWQLLLRLRIHQRLGTNESHQLRHSLGGILHRLWIIHIIWSSTNYPVSLDLNILFLLGGECRKPLSMEPDYLTKELL